MYDKLYLLYTIRSCFSTAPYFFFMIFSFIFCPVILKINGHLLLEQIAA